MSETQDIDTRLAELEREVSVLKEWYSAEDESGREWTIEALVAELGLTRRQALGVLALLASGSTLLGAVAQTARAESPTGTLHVDQIGTQDNPVSELWVDQQTNFNEHEHFESVSAEDSVTGVEPVANVGFYGAEGDGAVDDLTAVQDAFNIASGGGAVFFPPGDYRITDTIDVGSDTHVLMAPGAEIQFDGTGDIITISGESNIVWDGLYLDGQGNDENIHIQNAENVWFGNGEITSYGQIRVSDSIYVTFDSLYLENALDSGGAIRSSGGEYVTFRNIRLFETTHHGLAHGGRHNYFIGCYVERNGVLDAGTGGAGIYFNATERCHATGCIVKDSFGSAVKFSDSGPDITEDSGIYNSLIEHGDGGGFGAVPGIMIGATGDRVSVQNNHVVVDGRDQPGIEGVDGNNAIISGNLLRMINVGNPNSAGIALDIDGSSVYGNYIEGFDAAVADAGQDNVGLDLHGMALRGVSELEVDGQQSDNHWELIDVIEAGQDIDESVDVSEYNGPTDMVKISAKTLNNMDNLFITFDGVTDDDYIYVKRAGADFTEFANENEIDLIEGPGGSNNSRGEWHLFRGLNGRVGLWGNGAETQSFGAFSGVCVAGSYDDSTDFNTIDFETTGGASNVRIEVYGQS